MTENDQKREGKVNETQHGKGPDVKVKDSSDHSGVLHQKERSWPGRTIPSAPTRGKRHVDGNVIQLRGQPLCDLLAVLNIDLRHRPRTSPGGESRHADSNAANGTPSVLTSAAVKGSPYPRGTHCPRAHLFAALLWTGAPQNGLHKERAVSPAETLKVTSIHRHMGDGQLFSAVSEQRCAISEKNPTTSVAPVAPVTNTDPMQV
mmetsp:Transcript_67944/g.159331  ORF Transcript_67944/g.159331 Transcript_67944/m.159331 type:complete len:204 (+) Transcript_67944:220-831(+)